MKKYRPLMFKARAALEALRGGIVSRNVIELVAHGRESELETLKNHIESNTGGSTQIIVGGYGVGKSHLLEVMTERLLEDGYAVARLELGSSSERAENPNAVVGAIERSFRVRVQGHEYSGGEKLCLLRRALKSHHITDTYPIRSIMLEAHKKFDTNQLFERTEHIRVELTRADLLTEVVRLNSLAFDIPNVMTAANRAVKNIEVLSDDLKVKGNIKGFVLLFDEAERSEWASTPHREEQARNCLMWFATRAAQKSIENLKTYRDEWVEDIQEPFFMHAIFAFTHRWGLAYSLEHRLQSSALTLESLSKSERLEIAESIKTVYKIAYGKQSGKLEKPVLQKILQDTDNEDVRLFTRTLVAALDHFRLQVIQS